jgi:putative FmdB family regulatory protein
MTYEYVCETCGHQWEAEQSIKDSPLKKCVSCGENKAKRLVSGGTGFLLKGGGWYADLYASPGASAAKAEEKGGAEDKGKPAAEGAKTESPDTKGSTGETKSSGGEKSASTSTESSASTPTSTPAVGSAKAS